MGLIQPFITYLEDLSTRVPVEIFTFVGAFLEEVVAPIPSPLVMTIAGSIADSQGKAILFLLWLALIGAVGKSIGAILIYFIADKAEDIVIQRFGKFIGVSHKEIENIGRHFNGTEKDFLLILLARAIPIMPTAPISFISGIIKINQRKYLSATFLGLLVRNMFYLMVGYLGHEAYSNVIEGLDSIESIVQVLMAVALAGLVGWIYIKRKKTDPMEYIKSKFFK